MNRCLECGAIFLDVARQGICLNCRALDAIEDIEEFMEEALDDYGLDNGDDW